MLNWTEGYLKSIVVAGVFILSIATCITDLYLGADYNLSVLYIGLICLLYLVYPRVIAYALVTFSILIFLPAIISGSMTHTLLLEDLIALASLCVVSLTLNRYSSKAKVQILEKRLKDRENQLAHFAYVASHDLNEPLRTLTSFTKILEEEHSGEFKNETATYFRFINEAALKMKKLIAGLLDYSKLGSNISYERINLDKVLDNVEKDLNIKIGRNDMPVIKGLKRETELLFHSILENASKFRRKGKEFMVDVEVNTLDDGWIMKVTDNGIGVPTDKKKKIFELFTKLHSDSDYQGIGLGLAMSQRIVELHGGEIRAHESDTGGTVIEFNYKKPKNGVKEN